MTDDDMPTTFLDILQEIARFATATDEEADAETRRHMIVRLTRQAERMIGDSEHRGGT